MKSHRFLVEVQIFDVSCFNLEIEEHHRESSTSCGVRIQNTLFRESGQDLGSLKMPVSSFTASRRETLELLTRNLFLDSQFVHRKNPQEKRPQTEN